MDTVNAPIFPDDREATPIRTGSIGSIHPRLTAFQVVPARSGPPWVLLLIVAAVFFATISPTIFIDQVPKFRHGWLGFFCNAPFMVAAVVMVIWTARRLLLVAMCLRKSQDLRALPAPEIGGRYVGIAYTDGDWAFRGDTSWDRGWLGIEGDDLYFTGFGPRFRLPLALINSVQVRRTQIFMMHSLPRLYVTWHDLSGVRNVFSLEIRDTWSRSANIAEMDRLATWLREALATTGRETTNSPGELPFRSSGLDFSRYPSGPNVWKEERNAGIAWATVVTVAGVLIFAGIEKLTHVKLSLLDGLFGGVAITVYRVVVFKRFQSRLKASVSS